jgi:hypothetical protein
MTYVKASKWLLVLIETRPWPDAVHIIGDRDGATAVPQTVARDADRAPDEE